jgi:uncharacterized SAM-binding protein YcdF (DUF218 family)
MRTEIALSLLPPFGFVILIFIGLLLALRFRRGGLGLVWISAIALVVLSLPIVSTNLLMAMEPPLPTTPPADNPPKAIIILAADAIRDRAEALHNRPGLLTIDRLRTGAALQRRTGLPILVTGGTSRPDVSVAEVMARSLADDFRTAAKWVEPKSQDTWQNARFSADILKPEGITSVYVVTHAWHMPRALLAFKGTGLTVTAAPVSPDEPMRPDWQDFVPHLSAWTDAYYALHEWVGYVWYRSR